MRDLFILAIHVLVTLTKFFRPGGVRAVAADSLVLKHQLLICNLRAFTRPRPLPGLSTYYSSSDRELARRSMIWTAEKVLPAVNPSGW